MALRSLLLCFVCVMLCQGAAAAPVQVPEMDAPRRCIRGIVISSATALRVDATVRLDSLRQSSNNKTAGGFLFCGLGRGSYELEAFAPGYEPARVQLSSEVDQMNEVTIVLRPQFGQALPTREYGPTVSVKSLTIPKSARDQLSRFLRQAEKQQWQKCLQSLRKAVDIFPDYADAWTNMGVLYGQLQDVGMAEMAFKRSLEIEPGSAVVRRKLGYLYILSGKWDQALAELNAARGLDPSDRRAERYLEYAIRHKQPEP